MRIIIVGCGKVGAALAEQLSAEGHDLTLVDLSERRLGELTDMLDVASVAGSGTSYHVLKEAGVKETDLLIAATTHDEINLLSCLIASRASGCHTIARVRDPNMSPRSASSATSSAFHDHQPRAVHRPRGVPPDPLPSAIGVNTFAKGASSCSTSAYLPAPGWRAWPFARSTPS